jgi:hypothetical protein
MAAPGAGMPRTAPNCCRSCAKCKVRGWLKAAPWAAMLAQLPLAAHAGSFVAGRLAGCPECAPGAARFSAVARAWQVYSNITVPCRWLHSGRSSPPCAFNHAGNHSTTGTDRPACLASMLQRPGSTAASPLLPATTATASTPQRPATRRHRRRAPLQVAAWWPTGAYCSVKVSCDHISGAFLLRRVPFCCVYVEQ